MTTAYVDGDILPYKCGFAVQESTYETPDCEHFATLGKAKKHCADLKLDPAGIVVYTEAEELSHALRLVKNLLLRVKDKTGAAELKIFLSGDTNFRDSVATIQPYKGNRVAAKPLHFDAIRKYLLKNYDTEVTDGIEADDALGIAGMSDKDAVICTIDKDLNMIPGEHYNWDTDVKYSVEEHEALRNFYLQLCTGDTVDNIRGIPNVGPVIARRIVDSLPHTEEEMFYAVLKAYKTRGLTYDDMVETGKLLWIMREPNGVWEPPYPDL